MPKNLTQGRFVGLAAVALFVGAEAAWGRTLRVPEEYPSILRATDMAASGDSVLVGPGIWAEQEARVVQIGPNIQSVACVAFLKPGVTLISSEGANATSLFGSFVPGAGQVTVLHNEPGNQKTLLKGFTISGQFTGMIVASSSPLEMEGCRFVDISGDAVSISKYVPTDSPSNVTLRDCVVRDCPSPAGGVGAVHVVDSILEMYGTRFEHNIGGGISAWRMIRFIAEDCEFIDHPNWRAVSFSEFAGTVRFTRSLFLRNSVMSSAGSGGAINLSNVNNGLIEFCTFAFDSSVNNRAGAIDLAFSNCSIRSCTFDRCYARFGSSALRASAVTGTFDANVVSNCSGSPALRRSGGAFPPSCNVLWGNSGGDFEGEWLPSPTDIFSDPLYCFAPSIEDWSVDANSPCVPPGSGVCGSIGAWGVGCGAVSIESESWGKIKALYR